MVRDLVAFFCEGRGTEVDCGASRSYLVAFTDVSESVPLSLGLAGWPHVFTVCELARRNTGGGAKYCPTIGGSFATRVFSRGDECAVTEAELGGEGG